MVEKNKTPRTPVLHEAWTPNGRQRDNNIKRFPHVTRRALDCFWNASASIVSKIVSFLPTIVSRQSGCRFHNSTRKTLRRISSHKFLRRRTAKVYRNAHMPILPSRIFFVKTVLYRTIENCHDFSFHVLSWRTTIDFPSLFSTVFRINYVTYKSSINAVAQRFRGYVLWN